MLIPLELPPGVYRNGTDLQSAGRWRDANLVRWIDGTMRPIGGWSARFDVNDTTPRGAIAWRANNGNRWIALGMFNAAYAISQTGTVTDITPSGLTAGFERGTLNLGYGGGFYGADLYGNARDDSGAYTEAATWAFDTWGEELIGCSSADGKIYSWDLNTANDLTAVTNAPTGCLGAFVSDERFLVALGAGGDPRKVQWSDREARTTWTPAATNEAGDLTLATSGQIMCAVKLRGQALILTDQDAHTMTYQGPPFVYGFERVGFGCGVISRKAAAVVDSGAFWMGARGFHLFQGGQVQEIPCDVADYVFNRLNRSQRSLVHAISNSEYSEVWWFYPSSGATEIDSYVAYNYAEGHWAIGSLTRTTGVDRGVFDRPIWVDETGQAYNHETGLNYGSNSVYAETGPVSLANGDNVMSVNQLIPDEKTQGDVTATFKTRFYPNDAETSHGPYTMAAPTDVRFTGRQFRMRVSGNTADWRVGIMRVNAETRGRR